MIFSEKNSNVAKAFSEAWGSISTPKYNAKVKVTMKTGGSYSFEYTDLTGIFEAIKVMFKEYGLSIMQNAFTEEINGKNYACVETMLLHSSGEWVKSNTLKFAAANTMQDFGGQITYMKRYSLSALVGLSTDKDDDSNGYSGNQYEYQNKNKQTQNTPPPKQQTKPTIPAKLVMPKDAKEARNMILPEMFKAHVGKTLQKVWESDQNYIKTMASHAATPVELVEGILLIQQDIAMKAAKEKQGE